MTSLVEGLREIAVRHVMNMRKVSPLWQTWRDAMVPFVGNFEDADSILDLGSHLREILASTRPTGNASTRGQSDVAIAGKAWEGIVCWYLNLCLVGSRAVAMKFKKYHVPEVLRYAITVQHGNCTTSSKSDLVVTVFPNKEEYVEDLVDMNRRALLRRMNELTRRDFHELELGLVQCKTNWKDNAQFPMLWNTIYDMDRSRVQPVSVGVKGFTISALRNFTYSFVTVPSSLKSIKAANLPVVRVRTLSGSNYWGMETKSGIALSLSEIFNKNFRNSFEGLDGAPGDVRTSIQRNLHLLRTPDHDYLLNPVQDRNVG